MSGHKYHDDMVVNGMYMKHYLSTNDGKPAKGEFLCPYCNEYFITRISGVVNGHTKSCGCRKLSVRPGEQYGYLTVIKQVDSKDNNSCWLCKCKCGNTIIAKGKLLKRGAVKSCGCWQRTHSSPNKLDLKGKTFGYLTVLEEVGREKRYKGQNLVLWKCRCVCGKEIEVSSYFLTHSKRISCGCKKNKSFGESKIYQILEDNNIHFIHQKSFPDLRNPITNYLLFFDFYLPEHNVCIEFDGEQHYNCRPNDIFYKDFESIQYRDKIKNNYCKEHGIHLYRIRYKYVQLLSWDFLLDIIPELREKGEKVHCE